MLHYILAVNNKFISKHSNWKRKNVLPSYTHIPTIANIKLKFNDPCTLNRLHITNIVCMCM